MRRRLAAVLWLPMAFSLLSAPVPVVAAPRLPDLGIAQLSDIRIDTSSGRRLLRFTTVIVNVGDGPFEVRGSRSSTTAPMSGHQCLYDGTTCTLQSTSVAMQWSGDGHNHWHVTGLQKYVLERLDNGVKVGTGAKTGFCFFDNVMYRLTLPGAPSSARYTGCGTQASLAVTMGVSVGWGDRYSYYLTNQWIDITGLNAGRYRLTVTADPSGWFIEKTTSNNATWVDLQINGKGSSVKVLAYGPAA